MNTRVGLLFVVTFAPLAALLGGCDSYEDRCDLNPYSCSEGDAAGSTDTGPVAPDCGPCESDAGDGTCAPVPPGSPGDCKSKEICSADLECKKAPGESCWTGSGCATGVCAGEGGDKVCTACVADADCAESPESPLCSGGWCRRPAGAACETDVACVTNLCAGGACAPCLVDMECTSEQCDDDTNHCLAAPGEPCTLAADCASAHCEGGLCFP